MDGYWRWCIRDDDEREFVAETIEAVRKGEREWSEEDYRAALARRQKHGSLRERQDAGGEVNAESAEVRKDGEKVEEEGREDGVMSEKAESEEEDKKKA